MVICDLIVQQLSPHKKYISRFTLLKANNYLCLK